MKVAYPIAYRDEIVETQGKLFGRFQCEHPEADGEDFVTAYMRGKLRSLIDDAAAVPSNMTAEELQREFMEREGYVVRPGRPMDPLAADWIGQFYAYYQWRTGERSRDVIAHIPVRVMVAAYPGLHDLDLPLAVERVSGCAWCKQPDFGGGKTTTMRCGVHGYMFDPAVGCPVCNNKSR